MSIPGIVSIQSVNELTLFLDQKCRNSVNKETRNSVNNECKPGIVSIKRVKEKYDKRNV